MRSGIGIGIGIGIVAVGLSLAVTACNQDSADAIVNVAEDHSADDDAAFANAGAMSLAGQDFANQLAASDAFEVGSSKQAIDKARSRAVRDYAAKMVNVHIASREALKAGVSALEPAFTPSDALSPDQQQRLDGQRQLSGAAFERVYLSDQVDAHQAALDAARIYADNGDNPFLKRFAASAAPMIADHLQQARRLGGIPDRRKDGRENDDAAR